MKETSCCGQGCGNCTVCSLRTENARLATEKDDVRKLADLWHRESTKANTAVTRLERENARLAGALEAARDLIGRLASEACVACYLSPKSHCDTCGGECDGPCEDHEEQVGGVMNALDAALTAVPMLSLGEPDLGTPGGEETVPTGETGGGEPLTFDAFGAANRARCEAPLPQGFGRNLPEWDVVYWALALSGEAGEVAGAALAVAGQPWKGKTPDDVLDEVADVVAYADLLAQRLGWTLADAVARKWNRVSSKRGYPVMLAARDASRVPMPSGTGAPRETPGLDGCVHCERGHGLQAVAQCRHGACKHCVLAGLCERCNEMERREAAADASGPAPLNRKETP